MDEISQLLDQINFHNKKFWIDNDPQISDIEYDKLVRQYIALNGDLSKIEKIVPTNISNGSKIKHAIPMLSLDKRYHYSEVIDWARKISRNGNELFSIQPKFDGWAGKYENNMLCTRGDGIYGEDISNKMPLINPISDRIDENFNIISGTEPVLGEIILKKSMFNKVQPYLLRTNGKAYKTTRSALTGLLSSNETKSLNIKPLEFVDYDKYNTLQVTLNDLEKMNWEFLIAEVQEWDYPTDGLVIKLVDAEYSNSLGFTAHHPKGQVALKYGNPNGRSKLINVEWFVGKYNTINPVGIIAPIVIGGHEIRRANLHNAQNILSLGIKIGDTVIVERCGEIIPDIMKVIPGETRENITIDACPECGAELRYSSPSLYCTNSFCSGSAIKRLTDSCWRLGFNNIGDSTISKLIDIGVNNVADIFELTKNDLYQLPGYAATSVNNLYDEIQRVKNTPIPDWKILSCLNIKMIGETTSETIFRYTTFDKLLEMDLDEFEKIPTIGKEKSYSLLIGLDENNELLVKLLNTLTVIQTWGQDDTPKPKICFTGKMQYERQYYENLAETAGYKAVSTVTSELSLLVTSDLSSTKGKMQKAMKLKIPIIHIDDFLTKIENPKSSIIEEE